MRSLRNSTRLSLENLENRLVPSSSPWGCPEMTANISVQCETATTLPVCVSTDLGAGVFTIDSGADQAQTDGGTVLQPIGGNDMVDTIASVPDQIQTNGTSDVNLIIGGTVELNVPASDSVADQVWSKFNYEVNYAGDSTGEVHASESSHVDQIWTDGCQANDYMWA